MTKKGLYLKYHITKNDGSEIDPHADYFVLRLDTDPVARHAALTYARDVQRENPQLAEDIRERCEGYHMQWLEERGLLKDQREDP